MRGGERSCVLFVGGPIGVIGIGDLLATEIGFGQAPAVVGHARVRDGDTIVISGTPVRLKGLHCPELSEAGGAQASSAMSGMAAEQQVSCELTGERTYDRMVGRFVTWTGRISRQR